MSRFSWMGNRQTRFASTSGENEHRSGRSARLGDGSNPIRADLPLQLDPHLFPASYPCGTYENRPQTVFVALTVTFLPTDLTLCVKPNLRRKQQSLYFSMLPAVFSSLNLSLRGQSEAFWWIFHRIDAERVTINRLFLPCVPNNPSIRRKPLETLIAFRVMVLSV